MSAKMLTNEIIRALDELERAVIQNLDNKPMKGFHSQRRFCLTSCAVFN